MSSLHVSIRLLLLTRPPDNYKTQSLTSPSSLANRVVSLKFPLLIDSTPLFSPLNALFRSLARYFHCQTMDETSPLLIHDFTDDEIGVANILANLKTLIPLHEPPSLVPLTPSWISKRPRSALVSSTKSQPDRLKWDSAAVSGSGNRRNASPDSPLLLKSSPESCCVQGRLGPTRGKKGTRRPFRDGCKKDDDGDGGDGEGDDDVDDSVGVIRSKKKLKKEAMGGRDRKSEVLGSDFPVQINVTLALCGQPRDQLPVSQLALANCDRDPDLTNEASPHRSAHTSLTSPRAYSRPQFLFDLNLLPESTDTQSIPPDEDRKPGQTPYDRVAAYDCSSQAETAKAARKRRFQICRMKKGKCGTSKAHPLSSH